MSAIHMETDNVRALCTKLGEMSSQFYSQSSSIQTQVEMLDWTGNSKEEFISEVISNQRSLRTYAELLEQLKITLESEIAQWEEAAATFGAAGNSAAFMGISAIFHPIQTISAIWREWEIRAKWARISQGEREIIAQDLANQIAREYGFPPDTIEIQQIDDPSGMDSKGWRESGKIVIDVDNLMSRDYKDVLTIVAHETRHTMQNYFIEHPDQAPPEIPREQIETWRTNLSPGNYIEPADNFETYRNQPVEVDARDFADSYMERYLNSDDFDHAVSDLPVEAG